MKTCIVIKGRAYSSKRWKLIPGTDHYLADTDGNILNALTGKELKPVDNCKGYLRVDLHGEKEYVHRIVAKTFIANPDGLHVNHKDYDRQNNSANNLECITPKENYMHRDQRVWNVAKTDDVPF